VAENIVRNQDSPRHHVGNNRFVALGIVLFLRIQTTEPDLPESTQKLSRVSSHKFHNVCHSGGGKGLRREMRLLLQDLECDQLAARLPARKCKPECGVSAAGSNLDAVSFRRAGSENRE